MSCAPSWATPGLGHWHLHCAGILQQSAMWHVAPRQVLATQESVPGVWFGIASAAVLQNLLANHAGFDAASTRLNR